MLLLLRAGFFAALLVASSFSAHAADKPYQRDDLADSAIRFEAQIKKDTGPVTKSVAQLRRDVETAFQKKDFTTGMQVLSQIVTAAPDDTTNWLRLARTILQVWTPDDRQRALLIERAATAAYIAYQRTTSRNEEADSLIVLSRTFVDRKLWRPALDTLRLSLELREVAEVRANYEKLRDDHGFRLLDYTVDADVAAPRACFQFSEELPGKRTDFSPFVAVGGIDKPAVSVDEKQLCVEGLKHGEHYNVTLRTGLPSTVKERLAKSAEFNIYVRDRKPFVRFASKAYVLPRNGQNGIPVVSVNTTTVNIDVYRIGDRNLLDAVIGADFQRSLDRYELDRLGEERGAKVWKGELKVESTLNTEVTTAFPIDQAVGTLAAGIYVMAAEAAGGTGERYDSVATQWFIVSDLGLTAFSGNDGIHVFVHSLASADPRDRIDVKLLARNNEVLAMKRTNAAGHAVFEAGLGRGQGGLAPALLIATDPKGDYAFLNLKGPAFDLTDRGVAGRAVPATLDAFVYSERGVYRTGETVHITALLRDGRGVAATNLPLTFVVERPDGVEYRRAVIADQGLGGRSLDVPITATAPTGTWHLRAYTDPKGAPVGETSFMVEDYVPDRLEFDLASTATSIALAMPIEVTVNGRYLYGAPASNLDLEGEVAVVAAKERPGFADYQFGMVDEAEDAAAAERTPIDNMPQTDAGGSATVTANIDKAPATTRPLEAQIFVRMAEAGARAVERKLTLPIKARSTMIGVKPQFSGSSLGENDTASFDVVVVAPDGQTLSRNGVRYELLKVDSSYQYYRRDGAWNWEAVKTTRRMADGTVDVAPDKPGRISVPVTWGRYRLEISTGELDTPPTSIAFDAGFYAEAGAETPDLLETALDKPEYRAGDTMTVAVTARSAGKVTLNVVSDRLLVTTTKDVQVGLNRIPLTIGSDWGSGAYLVATLRRPLDAGVKRMPGRAIGVRWFSIDRKAKALALDMKLPSVQRPNTTLRVAIKLDGLAGDGARLVVAAVDVGILNLTNYKPPAPDDYYLGQRALTAEIRDLYGQLIDGMQGTRGQIRTGGDAGEAELQGSPPTGPPVALYSGIVTIGRDGGTEVSFDLPEFAGSLRVMAVAWSKDKVGHATADVIVRDPVVLTATLPRFLLVGDQGTMHLEVDNVEGEAGPYRITVQNDGPVALGNAGPHALTLAPKQRDSIALPLTASAAGVATLKVAIVGPNNFSAERSYKIAAQPATRVLARRTVREIAAGETITLSSDLFAELVPGTGSIAISVGPSTALDAATLLKVLDRYPFGCSEQITSRALPLLYVNELAAGAHLTLDGGIDQRIRDAIERLLARQGSNGSFGLWSAGGEDVWLDSYVTDFLTRARERGFAVPDVAFKLALERLRNFVANAPEPKKDGGRELAYALYVLARSGAAPVGDLRYVADTQLSDLETPIAKVQIGAALALLGDRPRAERVYAAALDAIPATPRFELSRSDYGSTLRDAAAFVVLASEGGAPRPTVMAAVQRVEMARAAFTSTSTQENAWMVLAARALAKDSKMTLDIGDEAHRGPLYRTFRPDALNAPIKLTNRGEGAVQAVISVNGAPTTPEPATEKGFTVERKYYTLGGDPADPSKVKQNTRLAVVLKVTEAQPQYGRVVLADYLPAGFEIDNPNIASSGDTGTLSWITDAAEPVHSEFRDDHFAAAFDRKNGDPAVFTVAYVVRAVSPGKYVLPQAFIEDMYRPDRFGRTATGTIEITAAK